MNTQSRLLEVIRVSLSDRGWLIGKGGAEGLAAGHTRGHEMLRE